MLEMKALARSCNCALDFSASKTISVCFLFLSKVNLRSVLGKSCRQQIVQENPLFLAKEPGKEAHAMKESPGFDVFCFHFLSQGVDSYRTMCPKDKLQLRQLKPCLRETCSFLSGGGKKGPHGLECRKTL